MNADQAKSSLAAVRICQNLYLAAEAIGGGACAIGAFYDDIINRILGLDGIEQFVIYITTTGKKARVSLDVE